MREARFAGAAMAALLLLIGDGPGLRSPGSPADGALRQCTQRSSVERLHGQTPADFLALRELVKVVLWGGPTMPAGRSSVEPFTGDATAILGAPLDRVDWFTFEMDARVQSRVLYVRARREPTGCLFLWHGGHQQGFITDKANPATQRPVYFSAGARALLREIAARGCDLLLFSMPFHGENLANGAELGVAEGGAHMAFARLKPTRGSALRFFTDPVIAALDHATSVRTYTVVGMGGLSGGGWATVLVSAIEPRIQASYSVAGSLPLYLRGARDRGDWEQVGGTELVAALDRWETTGAAELYEMVDYLDLYLMTVAEPDRRATLYYLAHDACCFRADLAGLFAAELVAHTEAGRFGVLRVVTDPVTVGHDATPLIRTDIEHDFFGERTGE